MDVGSAWRCSPARVSWRSPPSSTSRSTAGAVRCRPKALAARHSLPARHLEPVLQALVRMGILKGIRGPRGGYELARERRRITADEILRAAGTIEDGGDPEFASSDAAQPGGHAGDDPGGTGVRRGARPNQSRGSGAQGRAAARRVGVTVTRRNSLTPQRCNTVSRSPAVHGLDSFGAIPLARKVSMIRGR